MLLFVKDLTVIDFSYLCEKRGMVGESWIVDVVLDGGLDDQNMVLDFAKVKKNIKHTIDEIVDHRLLVPSLSAASRFEFTDENTMVDFNSEVGSMHLICPKEAFTFIEATEIAFDNVIDFLKQKLSIVLPDNVNAIELTFRTEKLDTPFYHYSHGLKKHDGNCQRIAHGHRSPVLVYENGEESLRWNQYWAERWQDIYLGSEEDNVAISSLDIDVEGINDESHYGFRYMAPQGEFQLAMPKTVTDMIPHDTTVELLADFMAETLHNMHPENDYKVVAYEGVGKGAIAFRHKSVQ